MNEIRQVDATRRFEPTEHYAAWRDHCPVHHERDHDPPFYVLTTFDDVVAVLKQPGLWNNRDGPRSAVPEAGSVGQRRRPGPRASPASAAGVVRPHRDQPPGTAAACDRRRADRRVPTDGRCDFVEQFAAPFPALAIADLLGVHADDRTEFGRWSNVAVAALSGDDMDAYTHAKSVLEDYIEAGCDERAAMLAAGDDIPDDVLTVLTLARRDATLAPSEVRHLGYQLLVAGHETTTSLLGMMLYRLLERPELLAALRADHGSSRSPSRRRCASTHRCTASSAPTPTSASSATGDPQRSKLQVTYAAANRDLQQFDDPDEFRARPRSSAVRRHVAFGWGIHFCIGAPLARLEAKVAFEQLLTRLDKIQLAGEPGRNDSFVLHGLTSLPIRFEQVG